MTLVETAEARTERHLDVLREDELRQLRQRVADLEATLDTSRNLLGALYLASSPVVVPRGPVAFKPDYELGVRLHFRDTGNQEWRRIYLNGESEVVLEGGVYRLVVALVKREGA